MSAGDRGPGGPGKLAILAVLMVLGLLIALAPRGGTDGRGARDASPAVAAPGQEAGPGVRQEFPLLREPAPRAPDAAPLPPPIEETGPDGKPAVPAL